MRRIVTMSVFALAVVTAGDSALTVQALQPLAVENPTMGVIRVEETQVPADTEAVEWAVDRYRQAGLSLPLIQVSFHADTETCEGARGGHLREDGVSRVFVCIPDTGRTRELKIKRVLLHEFAHAWDHHALTDQHRAEFIIFKGFPGWSFEVGYEQRASEDAAEIITWGLMDEPILLNSLQDTWTPEERREGYQILTGTEPPHGYVWSLFAAGHDVYAHTPTQIEIVEHAWESSETTGRLADHIEVRFHTNPLVCDGATTTSKLIDNRLHIHVCPGSESELATAIHNELTGG